MPRFFPSSLRETLFTFFSVQRRFRTDLVSPVRGSASPCRGSLTHSGADTVTASGMFLMTIGLCRLVKWWPYNLLWIHPPPPQYFVVLRLTGFSVALRLAQPGGGVFKRGNGLPPTSYPSPEPVERSAAWQRRRVQRSGRGNSSDEHLYRHDQPRSCVAPHLLQPLGVAKRWRVSGNAR